MPKGLPNNVKEHLQKARDSALLSVEIYNKPAVSFKSSGFISLMVIAWTSAFHAYFFRRNIKPFTKRGNRYEKIVERIGDKRVKVNKYWELRKCLEEYFQTDTQNPIRKNLEFFIPLRNMIEHRSIPELDADIFGECQQMLLNLDEFLHEKFGEKYCLRESLSFSLQLFPSSKSLVDVVKKNPKNKPLIDFITKYRSSLDTSIIDSSKYAFKAYLIKVANNNSQDALPIHFIDWSKLSDDEKKEIKNFGTVLIKEKTVAVINVGKLKANQVVESVNEKINDRNVTYYSEKGARSTRPFSVAVHTFCWKKFKIRPPRNAANPTQTKQEYCNYDEVHQDYVYTQSWVDFLVTQLKGNNYVMDFR